MKYINFRSFITLKNVSIATGLMILAVGTFLVPIAKGQSRFTGQWLVDSKWGGADQTYLELRQESWEGRGSWNSSFNIQLSDLRGLNQSQVMSNGAVVQFQLVRDAGTLNCEGWFKDGKGAGHYTFTPNQSYVSELRRRGYDAPTDEQQFTMAVHNVSYALMDELSAQGYDRPSLDTLVRTGTHGVNIEYVREMGGLGFRLKSVESLVRMRDHGVGPKFIKELNALGYNQLSAEEYVRVRDHGVNKIGRASCRERV